MWDQTDQFGQRMLAMHLIHEVKSYFWSELKPLLEAVLAARWKKTIHLSPVPISSSSPNLPQMTLLSAEMTELLRRWRVWTESNLDLSAEHEERQTHHPEAVRHLSQRWSFNNEKIVPRSFYSLCHLLIKNEFIKLDHNNHS